MSTPMGQLHVALAVIIQLEKGRRTCPNYILATWPAVTFSLPVFSLFLFGPKPPQFDFPLLNRPIHLDI